MVDEINQAVNGYGKQWAALIEERQDKDYFKKLKPVAVGWKVADQTEYQTVYQQLRPLCDRIVETWMNGRWIAKMHLRDTTLERSIEIIKLMERRPDSDDALGLDHVDFYHPDVEQAEEVLANEKDLKWSHESNDVVDNYDWISIWFDGNEAKLKAQTVIDIVTVELQEINNKLKKLED